MGKKTPILNTEIIPTNTCKTVRPANLLIFQAITLLCPVVTKTFFTFILIENRKKWINDLYCSDMIVFLGNLCTHAGIQLINLPLFCDTNKVFLLNWKLFLCIVDINLKFILFTAIWITFLSHFICNFDDFSKLSSSRAYFYIVLPFSK